MSWEGNAMHAAKLAAERELAEARAEIERLRGVLREINAIVHTPSGSQHAYTHFMRDFDAIRKLTRVRS